MQRCDSPPFYCHLGGNPSICETPELLHKLPSITTRANADDGGWWMNELSILVGLPLCTRLINKKVNIMYGNKDDSSMTLAWRDTGSWRRLWLPCTGSMAGMWLQFLPEYWNIVKLWFLSYLNGKQARLYGGLLMLQRLTIGFMMLAQCFVVLQSTLVRDTCHKAQQKPKKSARLYKKKYSVKMQKWTKTPNIPASRRGVRGELLVFVWVFFPGSAAKWRTGDSINHLHSFWSGPRAGSPGGALRAHGVHPRVGAV